MPASVRHSPRVVNAAMSSASGGLAYLIHNTQAQSADALLTDAKSSTPAKEIPLTSLILPLWIAHAIERANEVVLAAIQALRRRIPAERDGTVFNLEELAAFSVRSRHDSSFV